MFTPKASRKQSATYELRSTTVRVIVALTLLGGAIGTLLLASKSRLSWPQIAQAQEVTTTMATPHPNCAAIQYGQVFQSSIFSAFSEPDENYY
jgi:hypothetical protein